jgi:2-polyprenyl-6-hydroxyphenyl methylase/3-demethylubiquinone-9 3-methyltransferase
MSAKLRESVLEPVRKFGRLFIANQFWLSRSFDRLLPIHFRIDGSKSFIEEVAWSYVRPGMSVYDIGGGKHPLVDPAKKAQLGLRVTGLDVDAGELAQAPAGCYDDVCCCDIAEYRGSGTADLVICQATLEHVHDNAKAIAAIASVLRPGGTAAIFAPSRYAAYARLNLLLPEKVTRKMLDFVCPSNKGSHGFRAYYDKCSIHELCALGRQNGLEVASIHPYYLSGYFGIFFPAYVIWRLWFLLNYAVNRERAAETFTIIFRKPLKTGREEISALKPCAGEQVTAYARRHSQNIQAVKH